MISVESLNLKSTSAWLFFALIVALPFDNVFYHLFAVSLLITLGTYHWQARETLSSPYRSEGKRVLSAFGVICVSMIVSNLVNAQGFSAWYDLAVFIVRFILLFWVVYLLLAWRILTIQNIVIAVLASALVQTIFAIQGVWDGTWLRTRLVGATSNENVLGFHMGLGSIVVIVLLFSNATKLSFRSVALFALLLTFFICLIGSGNRGSWIALIPPIVLLCIANLKSRPLFICALLGSIALLIVYILLFKGGMPARRFEMLLEGNSAHRLQLWRISYDMFMAQPVLGYGLNYYDSFPTYRGIYAPHNIYISVGLALGSLGIAAYSCLLALIANALIRTRNIPAMAVLGYLLGVGFFSFDFHHDQHFMVIFMVTVAHITAQYAEAREKQ